MSIRKRLDYCHYTDPWQFCDDMWLMFDNSMAFNKTDPQAYQHCLKVSAD